MLNNRKIQQIITKLFIRGRNLSTAFFYYTILFWLRKNIILGSTHCFLMKISHKQEFQQITHNNWSHIEFEDIMNLYKKCAAKTYSFLMNDDPLAADNPLRFRSNLSEWIWKLIMEIDDKIRDEKS